MTCAGPYDVHRGGYQNLAVITARPVAEARGGVRDDTSEHPDERRAGEPGVPDAPEE